MYSSIVRAIAFASCVRWVSDLPDPPASGPLLLPNPTTSQRPPF
jgi:hypothetical protein